MLFMCSIRKDLQCDSRWFVAIFGSKDRETQFYLQLPVNLYDRQLIDERFLNFENLFSQLWKNAVYVFSKKNCNEVLHEFIVIFDS